MKSDGYCSSEQHEVEERGILDKVDGEMHKRRWDMMGIGQQGCVAYVCSAFNEVAG